MVDQVKKFCSNATGAETGFFKAVVQALESFNAGDTNSLGKLLVVTHGKVCKRIKRKEPARMVYATHLKRILDHSLQGVTYKFNKDADFGVVFEKGDNGGVDTDRIQALRNLGERTIRDKGYKDAFPVIRKDTSEKTLEQKQKQAKSWLIKFAKDNNMTVEAAKALVSGLTTTGSEPSF